MEKRWRNAVDSGKKVDVNIKVTYGNDGRPTSYNVKYKIEGDQSVTEKFKNESSK